MTLKKRHITFAWGPQGGGELKRLASIEFSITAGSGGKGTVWIDALTFTPLEPVHAYTGTPVATATSAARRTPGSVRRGWQIGDVVDQREVGECAELHARLRDDA